MAPKFIQTSFALACALTVFTTPLQANGLAGAYLAARTASAESDFEASSQYFSKALVNDPANPVLMENAIVAFMSLGDFDRALAVSRRLESLDEGNQITNMLRLAEVVKNGDYAAANELLDEGEKVGPLVDGLTRAWIQVGEGNMSAALASFEQLSEGAGLESFGMYHKALALALVGDFEGADEILSGKTGVDIPPTRNGVIARSEILSQLEKNDEALALIDGIFGVELDPALREIHDKLSAEEILPFTAVSSPQDGVAEVFFTVAGALAGEANDGYTLLYTRVAAYLRPSNSSTILLTARLLENLGRYELATDEYDLIPPDDSAYLAASLGRANALIRSDHREAAVEVLQQLAKSNPDQSVVHVDLGDLYRGLDRFGEAVESYDNAVALFDEPNAQQWGVYFARGISHERLDDFDLAEKDFRTALELNPEQPQVLNYLGYSFVELNRNLDEALDMIERAVAGRPNDGYITDSLGWVLYRLGRYDEAVGHMERAAELTPVDPVINDHLGDVYWAVGRQREAEFQWSRAMSFEPEEEDAKRIRRKLEVGLDVVLEEEGAKPLKVANEG